MNDLDNNIEQSIADDVRAVIGLVNEGTPVNEAIMKVAEDGGRCPDVVRTICGVFNKSKTVAHLQKYASGERSGDFELADATAVLQGIYGNTPVEKTSAELPVDGFEEEYEESEKTAEATGEGQGVGNERQETGGSGLCVCPACGNTSAHARGIPCNEVKCSKCGTNMIGVEKRAEEIARFEEAVFKGRQYAGMVKRALDDFDSRGKTLRYKMDKEVQRIASSLESMSEGQLRKVAQTIVNGYPRIGSNICRLIQSRMTRRLPEVEKTAFAAVFPKEEPYVGIAGLYDTAREILNVNATRKEFEKVSSVSDMGETTANFLRWVSDTRTPQPGSSTLSKIIAFPAGVLAQGVEAGTSGWRTPGVPGANVELLGSGVINTLKELDTKKTFLDLALYDKHLNKYPMADLAEAYNYAIETVRNPRDVPTIRAAMLRLIEQGGYRDVEQVKQEVEITEKRDKNLALVRTQVEKTKDDAKKFLEGRMGEKGQLLKARNLEESTARRKADKQMAAQKAKQDDTNKTSLSIIDKHIASGNLEAAKQGLSKIKGKNLKRLAQASISSAAFKRNAREEDEKKRKASNADTNRISKEENDIHSYAVAMRKAISARNLDKAEDVLTDILENYPEAISNPEVRELVRDMDFMDTSGNNQSSSTNSGTPGTPRTRSSADSAEEAAQDAEYLDPSAFQVMKAPDTGDFSEGATYREKMASKTGGRLVYCADKGNYGWLIDGGKNVVFNPGGERGPETIVPTSRIITQSPDPATAIRFVE